MIERMIANLHAKDPIWFVASIYGSQIIVSAAPGLTGYGISSYRHDDIYITLTAAPRIASGTGFVFNCGSPVFGTTMPLLALLIAGIRRQLPTVFFRLGNRHGKLLLLARVNLSRACREMERENRKETVASSAPAFWCGESSDGLRSNLLDARGDRFVPPQNSNSGRSVYRGKSVYKRGAGQYGGSRNETG